MGVLALLMTSVKEMFSLALAMADSPEPMLSKHWRFKSDD